MATAITAGHGRHFTGGTTQATAVQATGAKRGLVAQFFIDLGEDLRHNPFDAAAAPKSDLFKNHINAMAICYFAVIVLLLVGLLPLMKFF